MDFTNEFTVAAPVVDVFAFMLRAEEVAPCVPGASITGRIDETHYRGTVKVKVGPIQMEYNGELEMEPDRDANTITLLGRGTDRQGRGGASGRFVTRLSESPEGGTTVVIDSHVDVNGRVATFGRGIMQDVSNRMIREFAACLQTKLQEPPDSTSPESTAAETVPAVATQNTSVQPQEIMRPTAPHPTPAFSPQGAGELRMGKLIADVARSRIAQGLRALAERLEPQ